jgi:hypothetical protein
VRGLEDRKQLDEGLLGLGDEAPVDFRDVPAQLGIGAGRHHQLHPGVQRGAAVDRPQRIEGVA